MDRATLQKKYHEAIKMQGANPCRGKSFDEYYDCMTSAKPPANATQLKMRVGGESSKARIAFDILSESFIREIEPRQKAKWFIDIESSLQQNIDLLMDSVWDQFDPEVQALAKQRSLVLETKVQKLKSELNDADSVVDERDKHLKSLQVENDRLTSENRDIPSLKTQVAKLHTQVCDKDDIITKQERKLDRMRSVELDNNTLTTTIGLLNTQLTQSKADLSGLHQKYEALIERNGILEGELNSLRQHLASPPI